MSSKAIGIDLGTNFSRVAVFEYGNAKILEDHEGNRSIPSCVSFTDIERLFGSEAKRQAGMNPTNTVFGIKRCLGRKAYEERVKSDFKSWPFEVDHDNKKNLKIKVQYHCEQKVFEPEEISAIVLEQMKNMAERHLGHNVTDAVITVPAYFNHLQRQATIDAAKIAGLNVLRLINKSTAAAVAYGMEKRVSALRTMLIFSLGGGSFDVSVLTVEKGVFDVKSIAGDSHFGGEDFTEGLMKHFMKEIETKHKKDILTDKKALARLRTACERVKLSLSQLPDTSIEVDSLYNGVDFRSKITRADFEELNKELFQKVFVQVEKALLDAKVDKKNIDDVLLVGGSSRIPKIQAMLQEFFSANQLKRGINAEEAAALGAAVQAAILQGDKSNNIRDIRINDVNAKALCVHTKGGLMQIVINSNCKIPSQGTVIFITRKDTTDQASISLSEIEPEKRGIGRFTVYGFSKAPKCRVQLNINLAINENGTLDVSADQVKPHAIKNLAISSDKCKLTNEAIKQMKQYAEDDKFTDDERRKAFLSRTKLEEYIDDMEISFSEGLTNDYLKTKKNTVLKECNKTSLWLKQNPYASKADCDKKLEHLERFCKPILDKASKNRFSYAGSSSDGSATELRKSYPSSLNIEHLAQRQK